MASAYLVRQRARFQELRSDIQGLQDLAAAQDRDLTEDELRSVEEKAAAATKLASEIESLQEFETRSAAVNSLALEVAKPAAAEAAAEAPTETRSERLTGTAQVTLRDPGHYRKGGEFSFFGDMYRSTQHRDERAAERITEHTRALTTGVAGAGVVPPKWLVDEFETLARQGRKLAGAVRNISIAGDPRPITIPKQTAGTDSIVAAQAAENDAPTSTDAWTSSTDTITPVPMAGAQVFSRQMLDMANPAIDALIYGDLLSVYNLKVEQAVGSAMVTAAGTAVTTFASDATNFTATAAYDAVIDSAIAVRDGRKAPATLIAMGTARYGKFLKLKGSDNRPLINRDHGSMNVVGVGDVTTDGEIAGLAVIVTDGISTGSYPESTVVAKADDVILFEGDMMRFRYEEVSGPQSIKLGIWAYNAVTVRYSSTGACKRFVVSAA